MDDLEPNFNIDCILRFREYSRQREQYEQKKE